MANPLMRKAAKELEKKNKALANKTKQNKANLQNAFLEGGAGVLAGSAGAAVVDNTLGDGETAEIMETGLPLNLVAGGAVAVACAMFPKMPARYFVGFAGLGAAGTAVYQYTKENF